jgi:biopolymer transport protein ExbB/TolQ
MSSSFFLLFLLLFVIVIVIVAIRKVIDLWYRSNPTRYELERGINGVLFWGFLSAVVGFLGQISSIYFSLNALREAKDTGQPEVIMDLVSSFSTTIAGFWIFIFAAIIWFTFRSRLKSQLVKLNDKQS